MITDHGFLFVKAARGTMDPQHFQPYYETQELDWEDLQGADVVIVEYPSGNGMVWKDRWAMPSRYRAISSDDLRLMRKAGGQ